jgi:hypothetical protein
VRAWNCSPLSKLRVPLLAGTLECLPAQDGIIFLETAVCLCVCVWYEYELRTLAGRYLSLNQKWPPTFKSCHKIKQCFIYARYLCLLSCIAPSESIRTINSCKGFLIVVAGQYYVKARSPEHSAKKTLYVLESTHLIGRGWWWDKTKAWFSFSLKLYTLSHRMFGYIHRVLNID